MGGALSKMTRNIGNKNLLFAYILLALLSVLPYLNASQGEFVWDDTAFYVDNPAFTSDPNVGRFFLTSVWQQSKLQTKDPLYRPVFLTSMWVNQKLFGSNAFAHHLFSIGLHLAATLMLFSLLRRLLTDSGVLPALAGALVFAIHPIHVEAVAWISAYGHVMATFLLLAAMHCYLRNIDNMAVYWLGLSLILFAAALLTLEIAVAFPLLLTAYEYLRFRHIRLRRVVPFWIMLALYFAIRKGVLHEMTPLDMSSLSGWRTGLSFAMAYVEYLFIPWPQLVYAAVPESGIVTPSGGALTLVLGAAILALFRLQVPQKWLLIFGVVWIALTLVAPIVAAFTPRPLFALRTLYLPSVGISILAAWMVAVPLRSHRSAALAGLSLLIMAAVPATFMANRDWLVHTKVYEKILSVTPGALGTALSLAEEYEKQGDAPAAERVLLQAADYAQDDTSRITLYERLGLLYGIRGAITQSEQYYKKVLELTPNRSSAWVGLGNNAWAREDFPAALNAYLTAERADSTNYEAIYNSALVYGRLGNQSKAIEYFQRASALKQSKGGG